MTESRARERRPRARPVEDVPVTRIVVSPREVWRAGLVLVGVVALTAFLWFVLRDGGNVLFTVLMAWFASIAMEPAVARLSRRMRRGAATGIVMIGLAVATACFLLAFGRLFVDQVVAILQGLPGFVQGIVDWVNRRLSTRYDVGDVLQSLALTPEQVARYAGQVAGGVLGILGSVVGAVFSVFTFTLLTFYLSADAPRLRRWVAGLFPARVQDVVMTVWALTTEKTGGYVAARVTLAAINAALSTLVFLAVGLPYWLALGVWTGVVAQFVPTIGTYISIVLPVVVGLLSPRPWVGLVVLGWSVLYQQVENLTIEPRISARAVDMHPAVAFASVMLGAALFGVAGALLAVPVAAMGLAVLKAYGVRHEVIPAAGASTPDAEGPAPPRGSTGPSRSSESLAEVSRGSRAAPESGSGGAASTSSWTRSGGSAPG